MESQGSVLLRELEGAVISISPMDKSKIASVRRG